MGVIIVEVCDINRIAMENLEQLEEKYPGVSVLRSPCLSNCEICATRPYAYVNGEFISGATNEEVLMKIEEAVRKEWGQWQ